MESKFEEIWAVTASKSESGLARYGNIPHRYGWGRQVLYVAFVVLIFSLIIGYTRSLTGLAGHVKEWRPTPCWRWWP
ncbi:MAG: hypothetical protein J0H02_10710 [Armatimonadetes bacterium]|nr:hypothetical protein [Armatimonadota bacterium]